MLFQLATIQSVTFALSPRRKYAVILHSTLCIVGALSVFGWRVHVQSVSYWNVHLNELFVLYRIDLVKQQPLQPAKCFGHVTSTPWHCLACGKIDMTRVRMTRC